MLIRRAGDDARAMARLARREGAWRAVWACGPAVFACRYAPSGRHVPVFLRGIGRVSLRARSSDWDVFSQVMINGDYDAAFELIDDAQTALDGGANIGLATLALLRRYPNVAVVAVEPDAANYAMLERNTRAQRARVACVHAAIWSHDGEIRIEHDFRDGREWSRQVSERGAGEVVAARTIESLAASSGLPAFQLVKLDIEGAETEIFTHSAAGWTDGVESMIVELHPDSPFGDPRTGFESITEGWLRAESGEYVVARRVTAPAASTRS